ncbi:MAG TPA: hypothetical protein H9920_04150 [Candidatus Alistipes faecavium]|nr:hypothetical protein [Candidatus Alistipes faecavium]
MKRMILHWTSALLVSAAMLSTACDTSEAEENTPPVFPELQNLTIQVGETSCDVTFTPNLDWTVSIPTDAETSKWFELRDGEMPVSSISGKASTSPVTVTVATTEQEAFDDAPTCEVSLTMGGESQIIAKISRAAAIREFEFYASAYDTNEDDFVIPYEYSETAMTKYTGTETPETAPEGTIELKWPLRVGSYTYTFKSKSNFDWLASAPSWLEVTPTAIADEDGAYQVVVTASLTEENQDGAVGVIDFYDASIDKNEDPGNNAHNKYCVSIPAFRDLIRFPYSDMNATFTFNADGKYVSQSLGSDETLYDNLSTTVSSTKGLKIYAVDLREQWYYLTDWVTIEDTWDENGGVFQQHTYTVSVAANTGEERTATLLALPQTVAANITDPDYDLFNDAGTDIKEEYKQYVYASITQDGASSSVSGFSISPNAGSQHMFDNGSAKWEVIDSENYFYEDDYLMNFGDEFMNGVPIYRLTYNTEGCEGGSIILSIKGSFDYTFIGVSEEYLDAKWLDAESWSDMPGKTSMVVSMNVNPCETGVKGTIALYQGSNVVGRIVCVRNY